MPTDHVRAESLEFDVRSDEMLINMGPQHPSTHGVLRLVLRTDGEIVTEITPHIGYLHRCAEKIGENLTPRQFVPYTDRLDYLAAMNMNLGWALCVEKLLRLQVSEKTRHLRLIVCELSRIASHLVAAGCYGLDLGSFTPFMWTFREREKILDLFEEICGARLTYSYIAPGGVTADAPAGWLRHVEAFLDQFDPVVGDLHALLTNNAIFIRRTAGIGVLPAATAVNFGCTGPVLRGSGVDWDLRRDGEPLCTGMYDGYTYEVIAPKGRQVSAGPPLPARAGGGGRGRLLAPLLRPHARSRPIDVPGPSGNRKIQPGAGPVDRPIEVKKKLPRGEAYLETEAPKGQMGFMIISHGAAVPWRVRVRSSSFCNLSVMPELCRGVLVADVPSIAGSLDLVLGEIDR